MMQLFAAIGCAHVPAAQTSFVQERLSLVQTEPSDLFVVAHPPAPSQVADAWQSLGAHVYAVPPHAPFVQRSVVVHALPSLHATPFGAGAIEHAPLVESHVPATWH